MPVINPNDYLNMLYEAGGNKAIAELEMALKEFNQFPHPSMKGKYYHAGCVYSKVVELQEKAVETLSFFDDDSFDGTYYDEYVDKEDFYMFDPVEITKEEYMKALEERISKI